MDTEKSKSSILKPQKPRNPLADLNFTEPDIENDAPLTSTRRLSTRRVSFANSNFIKEFVSDHDNKVTIWTTSYEEALSNSSSQSSDDSHKNTLTQDSINSSQITKNVSMTNINTDKLLTTEMQNVQQTSVEYETNIPDVVLLKNDHKRNKTLECNKSNGEDISIGSKILSNIITQTFERHSDKSVRNTQTTTNFVNKHLPHDTEGVHFNKENLPIHSLSYHRRSSINQTPSCTIENELEIAKITSIMNSKQTRSFINPSYDDNNEYLKEHPSNMKNQTIMFDEGMEFTQQLSTNKCFSGIQTEVVDMELTQEDLTDKEEEVCHLNTDDTSTNVCMEFTQQVPNNIELPLHKTMNMEEPMEFTEVVPLDCNIALNLKNLNTVIMDQSMEFTSPISQANTTTQTAHSGSQMDITQCTTSTCKEEIAMDSENGSIQLDNLISSDVTLDKTTESGLNIRKETTENDKSMRNDHKDDSGIASADLQNIKSTRDASVCEITKEHSNNSSSNNIKNTISISNSIVLCENNIHDVSSQNLSSQQNVKASVHGKGIEFTSIIQNISSSANDSNLIVNNKVVIQLNTNPQDLHQVSYQEIDTFSSNVPENKQGNIEDAGDKQVTYKESSTVVQQIQDASKLKEKMGTHINPDSSSGNSKILNSSGASSSTTLSREYVCEEQTDLPAITENIQINEAEVNTNDDLIKNMEVYSKINTFQFLNTSNILKTNCGLSKSPGSSFYMDFTPIITPNINDTQESNKQGKFEFSVDDTQHLINYKLDNLKQNYSKSLMDECSFETEGIENNSLLPSSSECNKTTNKKRLSSESIKEAVLNKKRFLDTSEFCEIVHISQENIVLADVTLSDSIVPEVNHTIETENIVHPVCLNEDPEIEEFSYASELQALKDLREKLKEQTVETKKLTQKLLHQYDKEIKVFLKPFACSKSECKGDSSTTSSSECSLIDPVECEELIDMFNVNPDAVTNNRVLTLQEKVEEKHKRCNMYWNIISVEKDKYKFDTLFRSIQFVIHLKDETGIVNKFEAFSKLKETSEPVALFVHNILMQKLSYKQLQSAIGEQYDVLTLLDYVFLNMERMIDILNELHEFELRYGLEMDHNFRSTFKKVVLSTRSVWVISINMTDLENITENSVTCYAEFGHINEAEMKRFAKNCPRGVPFLRCFIEKVVSYARLLEKRKYKLQ